MFAGVKAEVRVIGCYIGLESPVFMSLQAWWGCRLTERNYVIINQIFIIARCMRVKFTLRYFLSVAARHRHPVPVGAKIDHIKKAGTNRKELSRGHIIFGLKDDQKWAGVIYDIAPFDTGSARHIAMSRRIISVEVLEFR